MQIAEEAVAPAQSQKYQNFIIRYNQNVHGDFDYRSDENFQIVNNLFGILYVAEQDVPELGFNSYSYSSIPKCYTYMDSGALSTSGVLKLHDHPYLNLKGAGTLVAVIDSGIDYRHPAFRNGNQSKIVSIWDQSLPGKRSDQIPYGREFTKKQIDEALSASDPLAIVPSTDQNGHGTELAATAAGNRMPEENFSGTAPEAELVIVKLKPAKKYLRDFYLLSDDAEVFQEDDIMLAISYVLQCAVKRKMPLSICIGLGSSMGAHRGDGPLSEFINSTASFSQNSISIAAGNEGTARHHYLSGTAGPTKTDAVELKVGERESVRGFSMEFWGDSPNFYNITIQSPTGEKLPVSSALKYGTQELSFVFVETKILVNYIPIERRTGKTLVFFRFLHPAPGIWKLFVEERMEDNTWFHLWLPVRGMISDETYFLESSPEFTITSPGDAKDGMTVTAYQHQDNSLYIQAGRGYNTENVVKPDFAAPGVGILTASIGAGRPFAEATGTSLAAAQSAGIAALLFEWALIRGNEPYFTGNSVKNYLSRGAVRDGEMQYPNPAWGYGRVDLYHTFELLT